ncbi:MAG: phosphatase [Bacteroidetes bacterium]|jgi:3-deoxy-D-manno-octulosonate 8-phosphate phosphatase (KDO 8-P phosphatase)|nr:phosphatase [Bacteroidota bacterium]
MQELERIYLALGGKFITPLDEIKTKLQNVKAIIFDWDGVFNDGSKAVTKDGSASSNFSEVDSMGTNLLRFSCYLQKKEMPVTAIISGEKNETAFYFCKRECFHYSFFKTATNKLDSLKYICEKENIKPEQVAYFFDDVLDLGIAEVCGLRILVNQKYNPLFADYCVKNKMVDYITAADGGNHAVRESTELLIALNGNYDTVLTERKNASENYKSYLEGRRAIATKYFTFKENKIEAVEM